jgi:hypothetical protein
MLRIAKIVIDQRGSDKIEAIAPLDRGDHGSFQEEGKIVLYDQTLASSSWKGDRGYMAQPAP